MSRVGMVKPGMCVSADQGNMFNACTGVDDERQHEDTSRGHGLRERARRRGDRPEDHRHGHGTGEGEQLVQEERPDFATQVGHEVQRQVDRERGDKLGRQVTDHTGDGFRERVVQRISRVLLDDRALGVQSQDLIENKHMWGTRNDKYAYLEHTGERIGQDGEKQQSTATVERLRGRLHVVEHTRDDERHDEITEDRDIEIRHVAHKPLEATLDTETNLLANREGVRGLDAPARTSVSGKQPPFEYYAQRLGLLAAAGALELLVLLAADGELRIVRLDIAEQLLPLGALFPPLRKFVRRARDALLKPWADNALRRVRERGQEVAGGLALGALKAHPEEELLGVGRAAEVNLTTLVEQDDLVKEIVRGLRRLVDGDERGGAGELGLMAKGAYELERRRRVETTGRVIPALERRLGEGGLRNGNALALTTTIARSAEVLVPRQQAHT